MLQLLKNNILLSWFHLGTCYSKVLRITSAAFWTYHNIIGHSCPQELQGLICFGNVSGYGEQNFHSPVLRYQREQPSYPTRQDRPLRNAHWHSGGMCRRSFLPKTKLSGCDASTGPCTSTHAQNAYALQFFGLVAITFLVLHDEKEKG